MTRVHMSPLRLFGDPFASDATGVALRVFLQVCIDSCMDIAIRAASPGEFGATASSPRAVLSPAETTAIQAALERTVPSTSPVVVFAAQAHTQAALELAALAWPKSCRVMAADRQRPEDLLTRVRAELHWAGTEDPDCGVDEMTLRPWLRMAQPETSHRILHLGSSDPSAGTDIAVRAFAQHFAAHGKTLRVVLPAGDPAFCGFLRQLAAESAPQGVDAVSALEIVTGPLQPAHARDCAVIVQPMRMRHDAEALVCLLASGRPMVATACRESAPIFGDRTAFAAVGGRLLPIRSGTLEVCEPDPAGILAGLQRFFGDGRIAAMTAARGRAHVIAELLADRPAAPPPRVAKLADARPSVVLEAAFLADGAAAEIAIATAQSLLARGATRLALVATAPLSRGIASLRARAPELVPLLTRDPGTPDLWLSGNPTLRTLRPECGVFAQRFDCDLGALASDLSPLLLQEQDVVLANRPSVQQLLVAAGRKPDATPVLGLGVDGAVFHEHQEPLDEVLQWKGARPAVLFVGSLTARSGFDLFLRSTLDATNAGQQFCVVVKPCGDTEDSGYLGGLIERFQRTQGAPPLLVIDRDLSRVDLARLYRACDVCVQPGRGLGSPLALLEARAVGLPVLATERGPADGMVPGAGFVSVDAKRRPVEGTVPHMQQPWMWEPDANALCAALCTVLSNLPRYAAAARKDAPMVRAKHNWDSSAEAIEHLAQAALRKRRGTTPERATVAVRDTVAL